MFIDLNINVGTRMHIVAHYLVSSDAVLSWMAHYDCSYLYILSYADAEAFTDKALENNRVYQGVLENIK